MTDPRTGATRTVAITGTGRTHTRYQPIRRRLIRTARRSRSSRPHPPNRPRSSPAIRARADFARSHRPGSTFSRSCRLRSDCAPIPAHRLSDAMALSDDRYTEIHAGAERIKAEKPYDKRDDAIAALDWLTFSDVRPARRPARTRAERHRADHQAGRRYRGAGESERGHPDQDEGERAGRAESTRWHLQRQVGGRQLSRCRAPAQGACSRCVRGSLTAGCSGRTAAGVARA